MKFKFIDLFAGIGGFHLVLKKLGGSCVFVSEKDINAQKTYLKNFNVQPFGDITKINAKLVPNHDILCGGFPCQAFSVSGLRKGFYDVRGTLFFDILRIVNEKRPKVLFLENVANLKKHDEGKTYLVMKNKLEDLGYYVSEQVLNAKDFNLPQNRERIIIVASLNKKFDFSKVKKTINKKRIRDVLDKIDEPINQNEFTILPKKMWKKQKSGLIFCGYRNKELRKGTNKKDKHLSRVHKQPNRVYHIDGVHPTLSSQETSGRYFVYDGEKVRKMSLRECYRIQGFPDTFVLNKSKSSAYRQIGNSIPLSLIDSVAKEIINQFFK